MRDKSQLTDEETLELRANLYATIGLMKNGDPVVGRSFSMAVDCLRAEKKGAKLTPAQLMQADKDLAGLQLEIAACKKAEEILASDEPYVKRGLQLALSSLSVIEENKLDIDPALQVSLWGLNLVAKADGNEASFFAQKNSEWQKLGLKLSKEKLATLKHTELAIAIIGRITMIDGQGEYSKFKSSEINAELHYFALNIQNITATINGLLNKGHIKEADTSGGQKNYMLTKTGALFAKLSMEKSSRTERSFT